MWPDLQTALDVINVYVEKHLVKPDQSMTKSMFMHCCDQRNAIDILKEYMTNHWGEAPASDIIYNFIKNQKRLTNNLKNDVFRQTVYDIAKDVFYYFI